MCSQKLGAIQTKWRQLLCPTFLPRGSSAASFKQQACTSIEVRNGRGPDTTIGVTNLAHPRGSSQQGRSSSAAVNNRSKSKHSPSWREARKPTRCGDSHRPMHSLNTCTEHPLGTSPTCTPCCVPATQSTTWCTPVRPRQVLAPSQLFHSAVRDAARMQGLLAVHRQMSAACAASAATFVGQGCVPAAWLPPANSGSCQALLLLS